MATSTEFSKPLNQDMSEKADKVSGATNGDLAGLDSNGNLTDSGKKASDFVGTSSFYATNIPMSSSDNTKVSSAIANAVNLSYPNVKVPATTSAINFNEHTVAEILKFEADSYVINSQNRPSIWAGTFCAVPLAQQNMTNNWGFGYQIYIDRKGDQFIRYIETDGNHNTTFGAWQQLALKSDIVKFTSIEIQTNSNGDKITSIPTSTNIVSAWSPSGAVLLGQYSGTWVFSLRSISDFSKITNTTVTVYYTYV